MPPDKVMGLYRPVTLVDDRAPWRSATPRS